MSTGRPREEAPEAGYLTIRQATERTGIPYTTLLHRIQKKRLEALEETTPGGEPRYYLSEETVRYLEQQTPDALTQDHLEQTEIALEEQVETNRQIIERAVEQIVRAMDGISGEVTTQRVEVTAHLAGIAATLDAQSEHFGPLVQEIITRLERLERIEFSIAEARSNSSALLDLQRELIQLQREKGESDRAHQQMMAEHARRQEERLDGLEKQGGSWWQRWFNFSSI